MVIERWSLSDSISGTTYVFERKKYSRTPKEDNIDYLYFKWKILSEKRGITLYRRVKDTHSYSQRQMTMDERTSKYLLGAFHGINIAEIKRIFLLCTICRKFRRDDAGQYFAENGDEITYIVNTKNINYLKGRY